MAGQEPYPVGFEYAQAIVRLPPATEAQLAALEGGFGRLPDDYRRFLATVNGGAPVPGFLDHPSYAFEIECFNGLGAPYEAYSVEWRSARTSRALARPVIAIAGNGAGDQLILLAPGDAAIYQWVHDEDIAPIHMTPSFTALLSSLVQGPEDF